MNTTSTTKQPRQAYGGIYCCVVGCHNNTYRDVPRGIKFHRFPSDPERRMLWAKAIKRADPNKPTDLWLPSDNSRICSTHFHEGRKSNNQFERGYIPSTFPTHETKHVSSHCARANRRESRGSRTPVPSLFPTHTVKERTADCARLKRTEDPTPRPRKKPRLIVVDSGTSTMLYR